MEKGKPNYYEKISLNNKTEEEAKRITELFENNINIAHKIASKYYKTGYWDYDEALQIAKMGLWKACLIWSPDKYRISTLAYNVINRDFMDYDKQQKKQPDILFNLEDNCVTEDLNLNDVLIDEEADVAQDYENDENLKELNENIIKTLENIAKELNLNNSIVKMVYLVYIESNQYPDLNLRQLDFIPRNTIKQIIALLKEYLAQLM